MVERSGAGPAVFHWHKADPATKLAHSTAMSCMNGSMAHPPRVITRIVKGMSEQQLPERLQHAVECGEVGERQLARSVLEARTLDSLLEVLR